MLALRSNNLLADSARVMIRQTFSRSVYKDRFSYDNAYHGKFDYADHNKYPKRVSHIQEEELLEEVHAIKAISLENPSPFHVVRRVRSMSKLPWNQKVTLRRLNLHSSFNGECVIVPNTPQFNALIDKVKHLLTLKPATFADGKVPTENDIGALRVCPYTGVVKVDERLRLQANRLNLEKPLLWQGNHLRHRLNLNYGLRTNIPQSF